VIEHKSGAVALDGGALQIAGSFGKYRFRLNSQVKKMTAGGFYINSGSIA